MDVEFWKKKLEEIVKERWDTCFYQGSVGHRVPRWKMDARSNYLSGYISAIRDILIAEG